MSKKGLFASLIITCVLTLSLGIYTLVSVFGGSGKPQGPTSVVENLAFRTNDIVEELTGYTEEDLTFNLEEEATNPLVLNEESGKYVAVNAGEVQVVINLDSKKNTKTLNITVYQQGNGSSESPYVIARAAHMKEFADLVNSVSAGKVVPEYVQLVADIDLGEYNWKPIGGQGNNEYTGTFDGNGKTIKNLSISVNATNYVDFLTIVSSNETLAYMDLGLFGRMKFATVKNLNMDNAVINVSSEIYSLIKDEVAAENGEYARIARLAVGTIAGTAYNSDIIGAEAKSNIVSRINAYSCGGRSQAHGLGGVVGVAQLVRVNNYNVKTNIVNNQELTKGSYVGGVFGYGRSSYNSAYKEDETAYTADHKTAIKNVDVDFSATLFYKNASYVGGVVGIGENVGIVDSKVSSFKVVDNTARQFIEYDLDSVTFAAGVAGVLRSIPTTGVPDSVAEEEARVIATAFVSGIENVSVKNVDTFMLGGNASGVVGLAGRTYKSGDLTETMVIKDTIVSGNIIANKVSGFAHQVNPGTTISYTKMFETAVVDMDLQGNMTAGLVLINLGKLAGFETTVQGAEEGAGTKVVRSKIDVNITGMGALIETPSAEFVEKVRAATFATGLVGLSYTNELLLENELGRAAIENFDVCVNATNSISYGGIAFKTNDVEIKNVFVNADFTSYNYSKLESNISTTYMVAGAVCEAGVGTELNKIVVIVNANKNITNKELNYGATFFGGLVARYTGDTEDKGLTIKDSTVSGDVYFNHSYENVVFSGETYNVFAAGGLIGAIATKTGAEDYVDALGAALIPNTATTITSNTVSALKITADLTGNVMGNQGFRVKGIGSLVGIINVELSDSVFDLSSNTITGVEIVADEDTFKYSYEIAGGASVNNITLGANKLNSYGSSYAWNTGVQGKVTNPEEQGVTYTALV